MVYTGDYLQTPLLEQTADNLLVRGPELDGFVHPIDQSGMVDYDYRWSNQISSALFGSLSGGVFDHDIRVSSVMEERPDLSYAVNATAEVSVQAGGWVKMASVFVVTKRQVFTCGHVFDGISEERVVEVIPN